jgi:hypothetical protein
MLLEVLWPLQNSSEGLVSTPEFFWKKLWPLQNASGGIIV